MYAIIDTGTTNTRVYIINDERKVIGKAYKKVGVRETAISGSNEILKNGLAECLNEAVKNADILINDIEFAVISGMLTTELGLIDIPHLIAPVGLDYLASESKIIRNTSIFPIDIPVLYIRGIKNDYGDIGMPGIRKIDFMKGEETQVIGALEKLKPRLPCNIVIFSSHTKLIHVNQKGEIEGSITTLSGQILEAIEKQTFIGKSVAENQSDYKDDYFSEHILDIAYKSVSSSGFLRTLMMPRFMEIILDTKSYERKFFLYAAIASEDIKILDEADQNLGFDTQTDYIFIGNKVRCKIYEYLFRLKGIKSNITLVWDRDEIDSFAIQGAIKIAYKLKDRIKKAFESVMI